MDHDITVIHIDGSISMQYVAGPSSTAQLVSYYARFPKARL